MDRFRALPSAASLEYELFTMARRHPRRGQYKTYGVIRCPYCAEDTRVEWASLKRSGARCPGCGALHTVDGFSERPAAITERAS